MNRQLNCTFNVNNQLVDHKWMVHVREDTNNDFKIPTQLDSPIWRCIEDGELFQSFDFTQLFQTVNELGIVGMMDETGTRVGWQFYKDLIPFIMIHPVDYNQSVRNDLQLIDNCMHCLIVDMANRSILTIRHNRMLQLTIDFLYQDFIEKIQTVRLQSQLSKFIHQQDETLNQISICVDRLDHFSRH